MADTNGFSTTTNGRLLRTLSALANRAMLASRMGWMFQGERRIQEVLGYKPALCYADYKAYYERGDLAHRIVKAYPDATWALPPTIQEDEKKGLETPFEATWKALAQRLHIYSQLKRADILANLGQYSVLLIGLRNQSDLAQPAQRVQRAEDVLYLTPYSEEFAEIVAFEADAGSPNFGKPSMYRFNFNRGQRQTVGRVTSPERKGLVHASRVLHIAEDLLDDDVYGIPRLQPIMNRLDDLLKVVGGSAEMFWRDAKRRIALELREGYRLEDAEEDTMSAEVAEYMHGLKDFIRVKGVDVENLSGHVASPKDHFDVIISSIAGSLPMPRRILLGSETGERASEQDLEQWKQDISIRQQQYAEPRILRSLIDRYLLLGALPVPVQPYTVFWDNIFALSESAQAVVAKDVATAANTLSPGMGERVISIPEYRERYLGLPPESEYEAALLDLEPGEEDEDAGDEET